MVGIEPHMAICPARGPYGHARDERVRDELGGHSPVAAIALADHECDEARGEPRHVTERQHFPRGEVDRYGWKTFGWIGTPFARERTELAKKESGAKWATTWVWKPYLRRRLLRPLAHKNIPCSLRALCRDDDLRARLVDFSHRDQRAT